MIKKTFCIKTLGCKVNQYESQLIREGFLRKGYVEDDSIDKADICIINTCTVTSTSDSKSLRLIRNAAKDPAKYVIVTGCMVEDKGMDLSKFSGVKFIVRNRDKSKIPFLVDNGRKARISEEDGRITGLKGHTRVFVKIQDGCDNICSYCKVRIVRGRAISRPFRDILEECRILIANGTKEIVLSGICLGAYGKDLRETGMNLPAVISDICRIDGDWRLRLSSIEPKYIDKELITQFQKQARLCKHLHIPFQCGDNYILKKMRRFYSRDDYLSIVKRLRRAVSNVAISTDIMVGFPGETERRFRNTWDFIKDVRPMRMHIFPFSKREGTPAYDYRDDLSDSVKKERMSRLLDLSKDLSLDFLKGFLGKDAAVLVEDKKTEDGCLQGYTDRYIKVYIDGPDGLKGRFVNCRLTLTKCKVYGILPSY